MKTEPIACDLSEREYLSLVLGDVRTLDAAPVPPGDLWWPRNQLILGAMMAVRGRGAELNLTELRLELERNGALRRAGGDEALFALTDHIVPASSGSALARRIRELARLRSVDAVLRRAGAAVHERDLAAVQSAIAELALEHEPEDELLGYHELIAAGAEATIDHLNREVEPLRFGTPAIDRDYRPGPGHLVVVAGRPNVGKTSLTFHWHLDCAERGIPSGIVSIDDDAAEYGARAMGALAGYNPARLWNERLEPAEAAVLFQRIQDRTGGEPLPIHFSHVRSKSIDAIEGVVSRMVRVHGCRWVSVDFLTKIRAPGRDQRERTNEALARLGILASTLEIPIVILAQLRRLGDRQFREPYLDDLKESGRVEEDAQAAVLLWRKSDRPGALVQGKLAKVKRTAAGRRFALARHPQTGLLVEVDDEPAEGDAWDD